jgi:exodeoxyribonuclease III
MHLSMIAVTLEIKQQPTMKIITWNCQGAFRRKADIILNLKPDILIVQECEHPDKCGIDLMIRKPNDYYWYGDSFHKGIGIFSYSDYKFELLGDFNPQFRYVLPFRVNHNGESFTLAAIWAMGNKVNYEARYIGQVWLAINYYTNLFNKSTLIIGDFNSNQIWDYKGRVGNHTDVVQKLENLNIYSIYHKHFKSEQGKEQHPTFYLQKNQKKPYHIDYCFASVDFLDKLVDVEIGTYENWITYSDHTPLIISFKLE